MEIQQLKYFQMVSRLNSVTRAANQLRVAQPSITVAIRKLEDELGVKLFDRSRKQLVLTVEGQVYLQHVDDILNRMQDLSMEMNDYRNQQQDSIRIGITPITGSILFPYIFTQFKQAYPTMHVLIVEDGTLAIRSLLEQCELDVGLIIISNVSSRLDTALITTGQILVCLPPKHPLGSCTSIPFPQLKDQPFILFKEDTYIRQMILEECNKHQFTPRIIFSSSQIKTILGLVEQGVGISFLLDAIVGENSNIFSRPLASPLFIQAGIAWNKERYLSTAAKTFTEFVKNFSTTR